MKKRLIPIILVVAVVVAVGFWLNKRAHANGGTPTLYGNVDIREVTLGFRVPGRLAEVLVDEGDTVKANEVLAQLDPAPYEREFEQSIGRLKAAEARLQLVSSGYRQQEIAQAQAALKEREATLANAQRVFARQQELWTSRAVSQQDRDDAEARFREAEARVRSAREQLALLQSGFRPEEVAQAQAEVAQAVAAKASAELRIQDTVLKSPSDGTVLTRAQEPGAILAAGIPVLTVSLQKPVWVRAYVPEPLLGKFGTGTPVTLTTDSRPEKAYQGKVGFVSPRAEFTPRNVETPELRTSLVYRLRIVVAEPDEALRQGMPVTVKLQQ